MLEFFSHVISLTTSLVYASKEHLFISAYQSSPVSLFSPIPATLSPSSWCGQLSWKNNKKKNGWKGKVMKKINQEFISDGNLRYLYGTR